MEPPKSIIRLPLSLVCTALLAASCGAKRDDHAGHASAPAAIDAGRNDATPAGDEANSDSTPKTTDAQDASALAQVIAKGPLALLSERGAPVSTKDGKTRIGVEYLAVVEQKLVFLGNVIERTGDQLGDIASRTMLYTYDPKAKAWSGKEVRELAKSGIDYDCQVTKALGKTTLFIMRVCQSETKYGFIDLASAAFASVPPPPQAVLDKIFLQFGAVDTGSEVLMWGSTSNYYSKPMTVGAALDIKTKKWRLMNTAKEPSQRGRFLTAWTGSKLLVWGGRYQTEAYSDGALYDPKSDTWESISAPNEKFTAGDAVVTAERLTVLGRQEIEPTEDAKETSKPAGFIFDLATRKWSALPDAGYPVPRMESSLAASPDRLVIWGGHTIERDETTGIESVTNYATGHSYDFKTGRWSEIPALGGLEGRSRATVRWTGGSFIVLFGVEYGMINDQSGRSTKTVTEAFKNGFSLGATP